MLYLEYATLKEATDVAEAAGRAYAKSIGKPWPMPPDSYGPGRQPVPPSDYYQRYVVAPIAFAETKQSGALLPITDDVVAIDGAVDTGGGKQITIDVKTATDEKLLSAKAQAELQVDGLFGTQDVAVIAAIDDAATEPSNGLGR